MNIYRWHIWAGHYINVNTFIYTYICDQDMGTGFKKTENCHNQSPGACIASGTRSHWPTRCIFKPQDAPTKLHACSPPPIPVKWVATRKWRRCVKAACPLAFLAAVKATSFAVSKYLAAALTSGCCWSIANYQILCSQQNVKKKSIYACLPLYPYIGVYIYIYICIRVSCGEACPYQPIKSTYVYIYIVTYR